MSRKEIICGLKDDIISLEEFVKSIKAEKIESHVVAKLKDTTPWILLFDSAKNGSYKWAYIDGILIIGRHDYISIEAAINYAIRSERTVYSYETSNEMFADLGSN